MPLPFFCGELSGRGIAPPLRIMVLCKSMVIPQNCVKLWNFFCTGFLSLIYQQFFLRRLWKNLWRMWITLC